jgi:hypothetical protein
MKTKRIQPTLSSSANMIVMIKWKDGSLSTHFCLNSLDDLYDVVDSISDPANAEGFASMSLADMKKGEYLDTWMSFNGNSAPVVLTNPRIKSKA